MTTDDQSLTLDQRSTMNTIDFYQEELLKIQRGEKATVHFNERQRKSLVKQGILKRKYGHGGCRLELTEKTKRIMDDEVNA